MTTLKKVKSIAVEDRIIIFQENDSRDNYITWWVNYFSHAIGKNIKWKYMKFQPNLFSHGLAYIDKEYIAFNPYVMQDYWNCGKLNDLKNLVAHEVQHFNHSDDEHHGKNFKKEMVKWTGFDK